MRTNAQRSVKMRAAALTRDMRAAMRELAKALDLRRKSARRVGFRHQDGNSHCAGRYEQRSACWLASDGYLEHARDVSRAGDKVRKFRRCENLRFARNTCFVLSEAGRGRVGGAKASTLMLASSSTPFALAVLGLLQKYERTILTSRSPGGKMTNAWGRTLLLSDG